MAHQLKPPTCTNNIPAMIQNYVKITLRNLRKTR